MLQNYFALLGSHLVETAQMSPLRFDECQHPMLLVLSFPNARLQLDQFSSDCIHGFTLSCLEVPKLFAQVSFEQQPLS
jgi:hypothetical protein